MDFRPPGRHHLSCGPRRGVAKGAHPGEATARHPLGVHTWVRAGCQGTGPQGTFAAPSLWIPQQEESPALVRALKAAGTQARPLEGCPPPPVVPTPTVPVMARWGQDLPEAGWVLAHLGVKTPVLWSLRSLGAPPSGSRPATAIGGLEPTLPLLPPTPETRDIPRPLQPPPHPIPSLPEETLDSASEPWRGREA